MKIDITTSRYTFELLEQGNPEFFAKGIIEDLSFATEVQRRVNNYDTLVEALRAVLRNPTIAGVIAADALTATQEG